MPEAARTPLHDLADGHPGRLDVELLDINEPAQIAELRGRLSGRSFDALFVNAGTTTPEQVPIGQVPTDDFVTVMVTNALSPMRVIEALQDLVTPAGLIGAMSSGQGSITNNTTGLRELYRGRKAAGGPDAPFTMEEAIPQVVTVLLAKTERPSLEYLDRFGRPVPW